MVQRHHHDRLDLFLADQCDLVQRHSGHCNGSFRWSYYGLHWRRLCIPHFDDRRAVEHRLSHYTCRELDRGLGIWLELRAVREADWGSRQWGLSRHAALLEWLHRRNYPLVIGRHLAHWIHYCIWIYCSILHLLRELLLQCQWYYVHRNCSNEVWMESLTLRSVGRIH